MGMCALRIFNEWHAALPHPGPQKRRGTAFSWGSRALETPHLLLAGSCGGDTGLKVVPGYSLMHNTFAPQAHCVQMHPHGPHNQVSEGAGEKGHGKGRWTFTEAGRGSIEPTKTGGGGVGERGSMTGAIISIGADPEGPRRNVSSPVTCRKSVHDACMSTTCCWAGRKLLCGGGGGDGTEAHLPNPPPPLLGRRAGRGVWVGAALPAVPRGGGGGPQHTWLKMIPMSR